MTWQAHSMISPAFEEPEDFLKIEPSFFYSSPIASSYLDLIQQILKVSLPPSLLEEKEAFFSRLNQFLPIVHYNSEDLASAQAFPITFLCPAEYTNGAGRYIIDTLTRWLIPGKQLPITGMISLNFRFTSHPATSLFLVQEMVLLSSSQELQIAKSNLPQLIKEMRINIMAVYHARYVTSLKNLSSQHKNQLIQLNLSSLLNPSNEWDQNLFEQFQGILSKIHVEETVGQVKKNILSLSTTHPQVFAPEAFHEIAQYSHLFKEYSPFPSNPHYISRVIACHYLLKKILQEKALNSPKQRHFHFKILGKSSRGSLGVLFGFNLLAETERFEFRHLSEGLRSCLPTLEVVPNSFIADKRHEKIRFFYWEVTQQRKNSFSLQEIKHIKEKLPNDLLQQIETPIHPIFMPRNEEEVLRNLILLSKQIKYVRDLPQVSLHYEAQSEAHLTFTVILVRLLKRSSLPLQQLLQGITTIKIEIDDIRKAGFLRKKYPKEAATLRVTLDKRPFFRADDSVDLLRARQRIAAELTKAIGEFRDFNGGIILKQEEALTQLRNSLSPLSAEMELLLENYFYSLRPGIMQTVYDTAILKKHFFLFQSLLMRKSKEASYEIKTSFIEKYFLIFIKGEAPSFKEPLLNAIDSSHRDLTTAFLESDCTAFLGCILKVDKEQQIELFEEKINLAMKTWEKSFLCPVLQSI